ncbi:hypothetical protein [Catenuloplanes japonicus]|uniref:hypothetical protein n=1 Tax=Catenuloplanes japonicus TaxID=33876 RepID=UPI00052611C8|nr:hypothetical protein [Catenuloplanes japonicus]
MGVMVEVQEQLVAKFQAIFPHLDERQRRLEMGAEARVLGHGPWPCRTSVCCLKLPEELRPSTSASSAARFGCLNHGQLPEELRLVQTADDHLRAVLASMKGSSFGADDGADSSAGNTKLT